MKHSRIYIYLARLDKKGIEVLVAFESQTKVYPSRIQDVGSLGLDRTIAQKIASEQSKNRMSHEVYAESAMSFNDLKDALRRRGYTNLPISQFNGYVASARLNKDAVVTKNSTMTRRASSVRQ